MSQTNGAKSKNTSMRSNQTKSSNKSKPSGSNTSNLSLKASRNSTFTSSSSTSKRTGFNQEVAQMQLDLKYNEYLIACLKKKILRDKIKEKKQMCLNQLLKVSDDLNDAQLYENNLKYEVLELEKKIKMEQNINKLKISIDQVKGLMDNKTIYLLKELLESNVNKLYLKNIEGLKGKAEYEELEKKISQLIEILETFKDKTGCIEKIDEIARLCKEIKISQTKAVEACDKLTELEEMLNTATLKEASDRLASDN